MGFQKWIKTGLLALLLLPVVGLCVKLFYLVLGFLLSYWTAGLCVLPFISAWLIYVHVNRLKLKVAAKEGVNRAFAVPLLIVLFLSIFFLDILFVHPFLTKQVLLLQCSSSSCKGELKGWYEMARRLRKVAATESHNVTNTWAVDSWEKAEYACRHVERRSVKRGCLAYQDAIYLRKAPLVLSAFLAR